MAEQRKESCLGAFFSDGVKNAVASPNPNKRYGYQSWVCQVNGNLFKDITKFAEQVK